MASREVNKLEMKVHITVRLKNNCILLSLGKDDALSKEDNLPIKKAELAKKSAVERMLPVKRCATVIRFFCIV